MIGSGAYGVVWSAIDKVNNEEVAIKKIQTAFNRAIDAKRILREIKILSKCVHRLTLQSSLTTKT
jgi:serine/threonine protein kinase